MVSVLPVVPARKYCAVYYLAHDSYYGMEEVIGSIPIRSTNKPTNLQLNSWQLSSVRGNTMEKAVKRPLRAGEDFRCVDRFELCSLAQHSHLSNLKVFAPKQSGGFSRIKWN
jgi:hypothetical protein